MVSIFAVTMLAAVTLKLLVVFIIYYHFATEAKKEKVAVAYAS